MLPLHNSHNLDNMDILHSSLDCQDRLNNRKQDYGAAMYREKVEQLRELQDELKELFVQCDELEYEIDEPLKAEETEVKVAACQPEKPRPTARTRSSPLICSRHRQVECSECILAIASSHHCQALIAICQECGLHHTVIADACQSQSKAQQMPVADGTVKGKPVSVMRYTGCFIVVARRSLVPDEKLTGLEERCILIDGTV